MRRLGIIVEGTAVACVGAAAFALRSHRDAPDPATTTSKTVVRKGAAPTLYCEITNFADWTPSVGFCFAIEGDGAKPVCPQIFQGQKDGTQDDLDRRPRLAWSYDDAQSPPVIHSPDDATQINLYDYDPRKPGSHWFEAGLRSVRYRNLGGKCRHSAT